MSGTIVLLLAAVFVIAAISKLRAKEAFRAVLRGVLPGLPDKMLAAAIPAIEFALAIFLLSGIAPQKAVVCAIILLALFTVVLAIMWRRGIKGCACFGESVNTATTGSGVARNIILIAAGMVAASRQEPITFLGPDLSSFIARLTVVAGALCLWSSVLALANQRSIFYNDANNFP